MDDLKTSAIVLPGIINTAMKHGVDIQGILRKFGISLDLKDITQSTINLEVVHAIVMEVEKVSKIPAMGLQTGEDFNWDYLPHLKTYLMSASTLRHAYHAMCRAKQLISPILILKLEETETNAILTLKLNAELSHEDERHYVEMVFSTIKTLFSRLLNKDFLPKFVHFRHQESRLLSIYEECFRCSVTLDASENAIIFNQSILDAPLPGGFPEIHHQAEQLIDQQLSDSPLQKGLAKSITRIMQKRKSLLTEPIEHVARCLYMSSRTLQRRLSEEGVSFIELKDQIRYKLAVSALKSGKLSIEDISEELGFSDRHSFTRTFKRLSGVSPSAFRKKHLV
ncbi:MAG: AraC family transcriptional regulator ligand-binding domain-containing protein [Deltaproteobacteria bacterium]|nr:AraC family transcriptional regulator ligand-binding domain-containing protein [Deltaproteobacteria bacterium]